MQNATQNATEINPYQILKVPMTADVEAVERAYNRLFDRYEAKAEGGDPEAVQILEDLNWAHDILADPAQRANLDRHLRKSGATRQTTDDRRQTMDSPRPARDTTQHSALSTQHSRKRPRAVTKQTTVSPLPWILGGVAALILTSVIAFAVSRNVNSPPDDNGVPEVPPGAVVATVNDQPIYERELNRRYQIDLEAQLSEPLILGIVERGGITGTRVLEVIKQDALDKLINMEVIQQEARKLEMYPSQNTQNELIAQAKITDVKPGETFQQSLQKNNFTEELYNRNVIQGAVYRVMASKFMPATGKQADRESAFINWMCQTRAAYNVKINIDFPNSKDNRPCSSGLPSDIALTGDQLPDPEDFPPDAEPTAEGPVIPAPQP